MRALSLLVPIAVVATAAILAACDDPGEDIPDGADVTATSSHTEETVEEATTVTTTTSSLNPSDSAVDESARPTITTVLVTPGPSLAPLGPDGELPARKSTPPPWLAAELYPREPGSTINVPDPGCAPNWDQTQPIPKGCEVLTVKYDPTAPFGSIANGCELGGTIDPLAAEMQRRARLRNGNDCVNGWQYEW
jgi:hypothetical protein